MQCTSCNHGELVRGEGTFEVENGDTRLVVRNVPALICSCCGDEYFEGTIVAELLEEAEKSSYSGTNIRDYVAA